MARELLLNCKSQIVRVKERGRKNSKWLETVLKTAKFTEKIAKENYKGVCVRACVCVCVCVCVLRRAWS
jgi:hypothetical protein